MYAVLTGRVSQISSNARLDEATNKYVYSGLGIQRGRMREMDFFVQDNWRVIVTGLVVILAAVFDTYRSRIIAGLRAR